MPATRRILCMLYIQAVLDIGERPDGEEGDEHHYGGMQRGAFVKQGHPMYGLLRAAEESSSNPSSSSSSSRERDIDSWTKSSSLLADPPEKGFFGNLKDSFIGNVERMGRKGKKPKPKPSAVSHPPGRQANQISDERKELIKGELKRRDAPPQLSREARTQQANLTTAERLEEETLRQERFENTQSNIARDRAYEMWNDPDRDNSWWHGPGRDESREQISHPPDRIKRDSAGTQSTRVTAGSQDGPPSRPKLKRGTMPKHMHGTTAAKAHRLHHTKVQAFKVREPCGECQEDKDCNQEGGHYVCGATSKKYPVDDLIVRQLASNRSWTKPKEKKRLATVTFKACVKSPVNQAALDKCVEHQLAYTVHGESTILEASKKTSKNESIISTESNSDQAKV